MGNKKPIEKERLNFEVNKHFATNLDNFKVIKLIFN
jgi:hypothetical protein